MNEIAEIFPDEELPELEPDPHHPANDEYNRRKNELMRYITALQNTLSPRDNNIIRARFAGTSVEETAKQFNVSKPTVTRVTTAQTAKKIAALMQRLQQSADGNTAELRKAILHRITVRNEIIQPRVAIMAIAEANKMDVNEHNIENDGFGGNVTININQKFFPKTPLDE